MTGEYESERTVSRVAAAEVLQRVALGVAAGAVRVGEDENGVTVDVPDAVDLEVEVEAADGGSSLEVELEWPDDPGALQGDTDAIAGEPGQAASSRHDDGDSADEGVPSVGVARDASSNAEFELFTDRSGDWRWRLVHDNGNIIADSGEGYARKTDAVNGLESVRRNADRADVVEQSE